ncbi:hypothetical protein M3Y96_01019400 [Aphelenchoides besseyi]|nr:hypothetical protein M3Y96_01019400 [Aphelenchoides besseyi]
MLQFQSFFFCTLLFGLIALAYDDFAPKAIFKAAISSIDSHEESYRTHPPKVLKFYRPGKREVKANEQSDSSDLFRDWGPYHG